jgi:predicted PurR-regulated permease PerM
MLGFTSKNKLQNVEITVSNRTVIRVLLLALASVLAVAAVRQASHALTLLFTAFFLALALNAPVSWLARRVPGKKRGSRAVGTAVSFLIVIALIGGFFASIVPPLVRQTSNFINTVPRLVDDVRNEHGKFGDIIQRYNLQDDIDDVTSDVSSRLKGAAGSAVSTAGRVSSSLFSVLTVLVLTFMMLVEGPKWARLSRRFIPHDQRPRADKLAGDMYKVVKGYVNGQVILAATASLMLLPALLVLHVPYPIALVVIVFICGLIPMVGHTIGAVIVSVVALFYSPVSAIAILAYYFLYQQIENYIVQPRIQANSTNMSPLLVFASVVVGVSFGGLFGGLIAIPIAGCLRILVLDYMDTKNLLDDAEQKALVDHPETVEIK